MKLDEALRLAKDFYRKLNLPDILEVYETADSWIVFGGVAGKVIYGSTGVAISKSSGEISDFPLPSDENFAILDRAAKIAVHDSGDTARE